MSNPLSVVDISSLDAGTGKKLLEAASSLGFLFVEGHGFSKTETDNLFKLSEEFFALQQLYKNQYVIDSSNHGYVRSGGENLAPGEQTSGDPKEALNISYLDFATGRSEKKIPDFFSGEKGALLESTIKKLYQLSLRVMKLMAIGLEMDDEDWFSHRFDPRKPSGSTFRLLHYPGQKSMSPETQIRAGAHTDYGLVTLLFQQEGQEGLEIHSKVSKKWEPVPFVASKSSNPNEAPPIIVNIGDQLSYWTAGLLKSTIHRVKFPAKVQETGQDRYSIVFFSHPNDDTILEPVPSKLTRAIEGRGANSERELITAKQHLERRLAATYGWKGGEKDAESKS